MKPTRRPSSIAPVTILAPVLMTDHPTPSPSNPTWSPTPLPSFKPTISGEPTRAGMGVFRQNIALQFRGLDAASLNSVFKASLKKSLATTLNILLADVSNPVFVALTMATAKTVLSEQQRSLGALGYTASMTVITIAMSEAEATTSLTQSMSSPSTQSSVMAYLQLFASNDGLKLTGLTLMGVAVENVTPTMAPSLAPPTPVVSTNEGLMLASVFAILILFICFSGVWVFGVRCKRGIDQVIYLKQPLTPKEIELQARYAHESSMLCYKEEGEKVFHDVCVDIHHESAAPNLSTSAGKSNGGSETVR